MLIKFKYIKQLHRSKHTIGVWVFVDGADDSFNGVCFGKALKEDSDDEFIWLLRSTIKCLTRPEEYFVEVIHGSIHKTGTDEGALTRVVVSRAEVDLKIIKEEYQRRHSVSLEKAITKDTSGDYEKMLLALTGHQDD